MNHSFKLGATALAAILALSACQQKTDAANKTAQDTQHDVAHGRCLTAHDAASNVTGQSTDQQTENKTKHCNAS